MPDESYVKMFNELEAMRDQVGYLLREVAFLERRADKTDEALRGFCSTVDPDSSMGKMLIRLRLWRSPKS